MEITEMLMLYNQLFACCSIAWLVWDRYRMKKELSDIRSYFEFMPHNNIDIDLSHKIAAGLERTRRQLSNMGIEDGSR